MSPLVSVVPSVTDRPVLSTTFSTSTVMMSSTTITFQPSIAPIIPSSNQLRKLDKLVLFSCFRPCTNVDCCSKCGTVYCNDWDNYYYSGCGRPPMLVD